MKLASAIVLAASACAPACRAPDATKNEPEHEQLLGAIEAYYADFSARDWTAFADHFWPGATITTIWQPPGESAARVVATTIPEFVARAPEGPGSKPIFEERMKCADVRWQGDLAHVWASYSARFGEPGDVVEWTGVDAFTWMKHGGRWRIVAIAFVNDE